MEECIFCKIAKGDIKADKVYEDEDVLAFRDIHPQSPTHIIVIPKAHYATLDDIPKGEMAVISKIFAAIQEVARSAKIEKTGYRTIVNTNRHAGQVVFHIHFHVMGGRQLGALG